MTEHRAEQYPSLPAVGWTSKAKERDARLAALNARNDMIRTGGAAVAVAHATGEKGSIGGGKIKESKAQ